MAYRHAMRVDQIALQLWTVRGAAADDLEATLRAVAAAGYEAVELAGLPELPDETLAALLRDRGLRAVASHEGMDRLRSDVDAVAARLQSLRCTRAVVPWLPVDERGSVDDVRAFAREMGGFAERLADRGLRLGYHNHDFEFAALAGTTIWDVLLDALPDTVELELDVHWLAVGGRDPVAEIDALKGRVRLLHMKDRTAGREPRDAPPGEGSLPFPEIVAAGRRADVEWYIVEQDEPVDALADVARGHAYLASLAEPRRS